MSLRIIHSRTGLQIGSVYLVPGKGWFCNPLTAARKPSRKPHPTADDAIPRWMKKMGIHIEYPAWE